MQSIVWFTKDLRLLIQSLIELDNTLRDQGQYLQVFFGNPIKYSLEKFKLDEKNLINFSTPTV